MRNRTLSTMGAEGVYAQQDPSTMGAEGVYAQ